MKQKQLDLYKLRSQQRKERQSLLPVRGPIRCLWSPHGRCGALQNGFLACTTSPQKLSSLLVNDTNMGPRAAFCLFIVLIWHLCHMPAMFSQGWWPSPGAVCTFRSVVFGDNQKAWKWGHSCSCTLYQWKAKAGHVQWLCSIIPLPVPYLAFFVFSPHISFLPTRQKASVPGEPQTGPL